jgi:capsular polysaccharide biosynthesis protein
MELRRYWQIIWRYWPVVAILTLVGVVAAALYYKDSPPTYQATAIVDVTQQPSPGDPYSGLYANQAGDFATDELVKIVPGNVFMTAVSKQLKEGNINFSPDDLKGMVTLEPKNRTVTITVNNSDQNAALKIAQTIANTLQSSAADYLQPRAVQVKIIDYPEQSNLSGGRTVLLAAVRILAGLLAGAALAFLLAYLDNSIRSKNELEELLGLPVMGLIPVASKLEASHATLAASPADDPIISSRPNLIQRQTTLETLPPATWTDQPAAGPEISKPAIAQAEPETEQAGIVPAKPKRASRSRKDQGHSTGKEELPTL